MATEVKETVTNLKELFTTLYALDVNEKVEQKNGLNYLSWAYAWAELKKRYPSASYTIERFGEEKKPYLFDSELGYMVFTTVTVNELTHEMWLPVMDGANKAMKDKPYKYQAKKWNNQTRKYDVIEKTVEQATMFDINKTIMRCLVKNIGMFGLGLYIYAGEDLPEQIENKSDEPVKDPQQMNMELVKQISISEEKIKELTELGVDITNAKTMEFIKKHNNGLTDVKSMKLEELYNYIRVLDKLIELKKGVKQ